MSIANDQLAQALGAGGVFSITFQAVAMGRDRWSQSETHRMVVQREVVIAALPSGPRPFSTIISSDAFEPQRVLSRKAGQTLARDFLSAIHYLAFECAEETHLPVSRIAVNPLGAREFFPVNIQVAMGLSDTGRENDFAIQAACELFIRRAPAALGVSLKERDRGTDDAFGPDEWQSWRDNIALAMQESTLLQATVAQARGKKKGDMEDESAAFARPPKPAARL